MLNLFGLSIHEDEIPVTENRDFILCQSLLKKASEAYLNGDFQEALKCLGRSLSEHPSFIPGWELELLCLLGLNQMENAAKVLIHAEMTCKEDKSILHLLDLFVNWKKKDQDSMMGKIASYERLVEQNRTEWARLTMMSLNGSISHSTLQGAIGRIHWDMTDVYYLLSSVYMLQHEKKYRHALEFLLHPMLLDPRQSYFYYLKSELLFQLREDKNALVQIETSLKLNPKNQKARDLRAVIEKMDIARKTWRLLRKMTF